MSRTAAIVRLTIVLLVSAGCLWLISLLRFDYDFEAFFPHHNEETSFYFQFREAFESDNDFFFVALENKEGIFQQDFLLRVDSLASELSLLPDMQEVLSPTTLTELVRDPALGQIFRNEWLHVREPELYASDSVSIWNTPGLIGTFFAPDGRSVAINMKHTQNLGKKKCDELSRAIEQAVSRYRFDGTHIIGRALGQRVYVEMMIKELALFISISLVLTVVFLWIAFRSGWGVLIPTLVVMLSIIWTMGFMKLIGKNIDVMITVLPTILFVVGMSDSVHFLSKYLQELRQGTDKVQAIMKSFKSIRLATFLTALTTAIGFLSLVFSNIRPVSEFAIYTSAGVMLAYGLTYTILPAVLLLARPTRMLTFALSEDYWTRRLHAMLRWVLRHRKSILWCAIMVVLLSLAGIMRVDINNVMLEDLRDNHRLKREFRFMEEHFAGCRPFELGIKLPAERSWNDEEVLRQLDTLDSWLANRYDVGSLLSAASLTKTVNRGLNAGQQGYYALPSDSAAQKLAFKLMQRRELKPLAALTWNEEKHWLRISGKVHDTGRRHFDSLNVQLREFIHSQCPLLTDYRITGTAHLIDLNNRLLVGSMVADLLLSIAVISLLMAAIYKSWKMVPLTIIPNIIPLILVGGFMGLVGIPLKISTSIIFNIAFGIAVDDTIHFLAQVRVWLGRGSSPHYAVKRTYLTTGKAMIVTTLILSAGFLTLVFSSFLGTFYIGLLISLTLLAAIVVEMTLTPLLIVLFFRNRKKQ